MKLSLRKPRFADAEALSAMCLRSKASWGYPPDFIQACRRDLTLTRDEIRLGGLIMAERGDTLCGMARLTIDGREAELQMLFVEPEQMGRGVGRILFDWCLSEAVHRRAYRMVLDSDPYAAPFYEKMGAYHAGIAASPTFPGRTLPRMEIMLRRPPIQMTA